MPSTTDNLSHRVRQLAIDMFARETGFSGPEIHSIFAEHTDALGPYQGWGGGSLSRWQIFDHGLESMPLQRQKAFLLELCE
jgi:hypothetical protein